VLPISARRPAALAALLLAAALAGCGGGKAPTLPAKGSLPDSADQVMFGLRHYLWNGGVRRAQLRADTAFFYDEMNRMELRNMRTTFYNAAGDSNAVMLAQRGTYDVRTQRLEGRGDVRITTTDGCKVTSPQLAYERLANQVTSDTSFVFTEPGRTLSGIGLRTDPQLRNLQVFRNASGISSTGAAGRAGAAARGGRADALRRARVGAGRTGGRDAPRRRVLAAARAAPPPGAGAGGRHLAPRGDRHGPARHGRRTRRQRRPRRFRAPRRQRRGGHRRPRARPAPGRGRPDGALRAQRDLQQPPRLSDVARAVPDGRRGELDLVLRRRRVRAVPRGREHAPGGQRRVLRDGRAAHPDR
jgi:LPS export ABC transporter protein LptC